jgi:hypothetical protein
METLQDLWYSEIDPIPGKDFFNHGLENKCLCSASIASILDLQLNKDQEINLSCIAYDVLPKEIGPLLFNLRRASYPPKDMFDSENLYDLNQMIKVASYFQMGFIQVVLEEALRLHTLDRE